MQRAWRDATAAINAAPSGARSRTRERNRGEYCRAIKTSRAFADIDTTAVYDGQRRLQSSKSLDTRLMGLHLHLRPIDAFVPRSRVGFRRPRTIAISDNKTRYCFRCVGSRPIASDFRRSRVKENLNSSLPNCMTI